LILQINIHTTKYSLLYRTHPFWFSEQFDEATRLFMPLLGKNHWILLAVDWKKTKISLENSMARARDGAY
jgi:hypothetical protein